MKLKEGMYCEIKDKFQYEYLIDLAKEHNIFICLQSVILSCTYEAIRTRFPNSENAIPTVSYTKYFRIDEHPGLNVNKGQLLIPWNEFIKLMIEC